MQRDAVLERYLSGLDQYHPETGGLLAIERAGFLNDLDKHITNLELEVKRIETLETMQARGLTHV